MLCKAASLLSALNTLLALTRRTASVSFEEKLLLLWSARPLQSPQSGRHRVVENQRHLAGRFW